MNLQKRKAVGWALMNISPLEYFVETNMSVTPRNIPMNQGRSHCYSTSERPDTLG